VLSVKCGVLLAFSAKNQIKTQNATISSIDFDVLNTSSFNRHNNSGKVIKNLAAMLSSTILRVTRLLTAGVC